jgi:hypothetical protein
LNGVPSDLVRELLAQSLLAWRLAGTVRVEGESTIVTCGNKDIQIDRTPHDSMFRWFVTVERRRRGASSLVAVLRQVRSALEPDYTANRVRIGERFADLGPVPPR